MNVIQGIQKFGVVGVLLTFLLVFIIGVVPVFAAAPSNDNMAGAAVVSSLPYTDTVDTSEATVEGSEPAYDCGWNVGATVWYSYTPTTSGDVSVNTQGSDFSTVLHVFEASGMALVGCDDSGWDAQVFFSATAGTTYLISVGGYNGYTGNLGFNIVESGAFSTCSAIADVPEAECDALVAFYTATAGASWFDNSQWLATDLVCTWHGVNCVDGSVVVVYLYNNNLVGDLGSVVFTGLSNLITFSVANNDLVGDMSTIIGNLPTGTQSLYLNRNEFTGTIPAGISGFSNLGALYVNDNQLSGDIAPIMANLPTGIFALSIKINNFYGSIPTEASGLTNLYYFSGEANLLSGDISDVIGNLPTSLQYMILGSNDFTGIIPAGISSFSFLREFDVGKNEINGDIASVINNLPNSLENVSLEQNNFTGTIPSSISSLTNLIDLNVGGNQLVGDLSTIVGYLSTTIEFLYMDDNGFTGTIPAGISSFTNLDYFVINSNPGLYGTIPLSITGLPLRNFDFQQTFLCEPDDSGYDTWKAGVTYYHPGYCEPAAFLLFEDDFETGDFSLWTRFNDGNGYLYPCMDAAINGTWGACVDRGTDKRKQLIDETPLNQTTYHVRFNIDINSLWMAEGTRFRFMQVKMGADRPFFIVVKRQGGQYLMQLNTLVDGIIKVKTGWYPITNAPHTIEVSWSSATFEGDNDGWAILYLDDTPLEVLADLDNDTIYVDTFKIGFTSRLDGKAISGIFYLDDIATSNSGYIGGP